MGENIWKSEKHTCRLRFGKCLLNNVMNFMGKHLDGKCNYCVASHIEEEEKEDVKNYLMDCMEFVHLRENNIYLKRKFHIISLF